MENKETVVREFHYEYDENGNLTRKTTNETITKPRNDCPYNEGELITSEIDFAKDEPTFADIALALAGLGLCLTAVATIFKRH